MVKPHQLQQGLLMLAIGAFFLYIGRWTASPEVIPRHHMTPVESEQGQSAELQAKVVQLEAELASVKAAAAAPVPRGDKEVKQAAASLEEKPFRTSHRCVMTGAWGDYCVYENVCFKSAKELVWVAEEFVKGPGHKGTVKFTTKLPMNEPHDGRMYPALTHLTIEHMKPEDFEKENPIWADTSKGATYIASYWDKLANIWYWSTRMLPLFTAELYADTLNLPPVGEVVVPMIEHKATHTWAKAMLNVTLSDPENTKVYFVESAPYFGMSGSDGRMVCTRQAVVMGAQVYGVPDMVVGRALKKKVYAAVGLPPPPLQQFGAPELPFKVVLLDRRSRDPRHVVNVKEVEAIVTKYGAEFERVEMGDDVSFEDQVKLFASTGVLLAVHGAGLMNQVFMQPGSVTIEVFPNHVKHVLYERIAMMAGVYHFKVYSDDFPPGHLAADDPYVRHNCDKVLSMEIPEEEGGYCWRIVKNGNVAIPLQQFEEAVVQALDFLRRTKVKAD